MSAEVVERAVIRYRCSVCHRSSSKRSAMAAHVERGCLKDPDARGCGTCKHDERGDSGDPRFPGTDTPPHCAVGARDDYETFKLHCDQWEAR